MAGGHFEKGYDPRRNLKGRPPTGCATREIALELAEIMDATIPGPKGKNIVVSRKRALLEKIYRKALVDEDPGMMRYLGNLLFQNDHDFTPTPDGEEPKEMLDSEIEDLLQELKRDQEGSTSTVQASPRPRRKAGTGKKPAPKARKDRPVLSPRVPAKSKGR